MLSLTQRARDFIESLQDDPQPKAARASGALLPAWLRKARAAEQPAASPATQARPQRGELWHVRLPGASISAWLLITAFDTSKAHVEGLLAHGEVWLAGPRDVIVEEARSPTGRALVICPEWGAHLSAATLERSDARRLGEVPRWQVAIAALGALGTPEQERFDARDEVVLLTRRCEARAGALYLSAPTRPPHVARALEGAMRAYAAQAGMISQRPGWCAQLYERLRSALQPTRASYTSQPALLATVGPLRSAHPPSPAGRELVAELEITEGALHVELAVEFDHEARGVHMSVFASLDGLPAAGAQAEIWCGDTLAWPALTLDADGLAETDSAIELASSDTCTIRVRAGDHVLERQF